MLKDNFISYLSMRHVLPTPEAPKVITKFIKKENYYKICYYL